MNLNKTNAMIVSIAITVILIIAGCETNQKEEKAKPEKKDTTRIVFNINESWISNWDDTDNIDSPAFWKNPKGEYWIVATAKESDVLVVYDATNGDEIKRYCESGTAPGQLERPNGIKIIDDLALIVERDNQRVQIFSLPEFNHLGFIGEGLKNPYGLDCYNKGEEYILYVTDNYETIDEQIPPADMLDERVHIYSFTIADGKVESKLIKKFGETEGEGVLNIVESIMLDPEKDMLLLAEEDETQSKIKCYNMQGKFVRSFGYGYFEGQAEGIALYDTGNGSGYWICTDQSETNNVFNIFDRNSFEYIASFSGDSTSNTDGIALTEMSFSDFPEGAIFACDDDGGITAFNWKSIADSIKTMK